MLVVGLGGGSLPLFVHDYFLQARVAVVEIDPSMLEVATHWFGFSQDDRMQVHIADGLDHVAKLAAEGTVLQSFNSISCPALLLVSNSASCLSLCYPVPPQQPRCGMVFPMFLQHLMPCVTSSNLDRSLQQADLSLSVCVQGPSICCLSPVQKVLSEEAAGSGRGGSLATMFAASSPSVANPCAME